ncbi:hypothetical protein [Vibrio sp. D431a]|uniref:DUF4870 family protein n=1 Tax=Vibrio sp. D431a TaxID=2837388 RepID=UPI00255579F5|nr:hypothetical protein [Vibrio sp. D431a]MDK9789822.1 hypothetical protein [Vibrio sp. D431a]
MLDKELKSELEERNRVETNDVELEPIKNKEEGESDLDSNPVIEEDKEALQSEGEVINAPAVMEKDNPTLIWITYLMFGLGVFTLGLFSLAGVIMAHVNGVDGSSLDRDHCRYLQRTFWFGVMWTIVASLVFTISLPVAVLGGALGTSVMMLSWSVFWVVSIWYLYRVLKGYVFYAKHKHNY